MLRGFRYSAYSSAYRRCYQGSLPSLVKNFPLDGLHSVHDYAVYSIKGCGRSTAGEHCG